MTFQAQKSYLPAEWQPQSAVLLTWPHLDSDWADNLANVEPTFVMLAETISRYQAVVVICQSTDHQAHVRRLLNKPAAYVIHYAITPSNDTWTRDFGPISIYEHGQAKLLNFEFNAWGNRYASDLDNQINSVLGQQKRFNIPIETRAFILEGGSIESDGQGSILTTSACLLSGNRNPGKQQDIENDLKQQLPIKRVMWIQHGTLIGDDTDSHIDNLVRFVSADTLVYTACADVRDEHYPSLAKLASELNMLTTLTGKPYQLIALPLPQAIYSQTDKRRLPASYANFLIINGAVLVPQFADPADQLAIKLLSQCFPDRDIIGIDSRSFIEQNGGIHCLTMQLTAGAI